MTRCFTVGSYPCEQSKTRCVLVAHKSTLGSCKLISFCVNNPVFRLLVNFIVIFLGFEKKYLFFYLVF